VDEGMDPGPYVEPVERRMVGVGSCVVLMRAIRRRTDEW
jgi:hypothetical protein